MKQIYTFTLISLLLIGCSNPKPGEVEYIDKLKVYHLADGILVKEKTHENDYYYLIEGSRVDYEMTEEGLRFEVKEEDVMGGAFNRDDAGYVSAWFKDLDGQGPVATRFPTDDAKFADALQNFSSTTTVLDVYNHNRQIRTKLQARHSMKEHKSFRPSDFSLRDIPGFGLIYIIIAVVLVGIGLLVEQFTDIWKGVLLGFGFC